MRTTIDIPDQIAPTLRSVARDRGVSLSRIVGELLVQAVEGGSSSVQHSTRSGFPVLTGGSRIYTNEDVRALDDEP